MALDASLQFTTIIRDDQIKKKLNKFKMQLKVLLICTFVGCAVAQRGHYAGASRPILGARYQNLDTDSRSSAVATNQVSNTAQPSPVSNIAQPSQSSNFVAPQNQGFNGNRFNGIESNRINQQYPRGNFGGFNDFGGFHGFGFPPHGPPFGHDGFYGR